MRLRGVSNLDLKIRSGVEPNGGMVEFVVTDRLRESELTQVRRDLMKYMRDHDEARGVIVYLCKATVPFCDDAEVRPRAAACRGV